MREEKGILQPNVDNVLWQKMLKTITLYNEVCLNNSHAGFSHNLFTTPVVMQYVPSMVIMINLLLTNTTGSYKARVRKHVQHHSFICLYCMYGEDKHVQMDHVSITDNLSIVIYINRL